MELERIIEVTQTNLKTLEAKKYSAKTRRNAHIRELGLALSEYFPKDGEEIEDFRYRTEDIIDSLKLKAEECVTLCRAIAQSLGDIKGRIPYLPAKRRCRLSYVKNPLSDLAYDSFSMFFDRATVSYAEDFVSACEDVYHSQSDYAVLPVYSEKSGRLKSFCDLADKYELKKILTCRVYSNTDDTETEFALFSKNCERVMSNRRREVFFELTLPDTHILSVMEYVRNSECEIIWINTNDERADICLEIPEAEITALYIYLILCLPDHEIKGIY